MGYSDFSLPDIEQRLGCAIREHPDLFAGVADAVPSDLLRCLLDVYLPLALAINTEKGRSELLIAPILVEVRERSGHLVSLFSGTELSADPERGLTGYCDFILSRSPQQQYLRAPIVTVVEAKNENLKSGIGQCLASMIGAQVFNERRGEAVGRPLWGGHNRDAVAVPGPGGERGDHRCPGIPHRASRAHPGRDSRDGRGDTGAVGVIPIAACQPPGKRRRNSSISRRKRSISARSALRSASIRRVVSWLSRAMISTRRRAASNSRVVRS